MEYTVYHLHKMAHNISSPSQHLQFTTVAFVEGFNFHILKVCELVA